MRRILEVDDAPVGLPVIKARGRGAARRRSRRHPGPAIKRRAGPFVALGDPYDDLADEGWQDASSDLARRSRTMIIKPEQSDKALVEPQPIASRGSSASSRNAS